MDIRLQLGGITFRLCSRRNLVIDPEWELFLTKRKDDKEIIININWDWDTITIPREHLLGEDAICDYYYDGMLNYCVTRGGPKGPVACTVYTSDFSKIECIINEKPFLESPKKIGSIMRMIPVREIFLSNNILFLHAAQIAMKGTGVLFTAPSGTGKTTQAKLWQKYRNIEIVCNDRTLTGKVGNKWLTWGYPLDGSEPVISTEVNKLGAVILLKQGKTNTVETLKVGQAVTFLMRQVVFDYWKGQAREKVMDLLFTLLEDIPIFLLTCTPDKRAVDILEKKLIKSKVII